MIGKEFRKVFGKVFGKVLGKECKKQSQESNQTELKSRAEETKKGTVFTSLGRLSRRANRVEFLPTGRPCLVLLA